MDRTGGTSTPLEAVIITVRHCTLFTSAERVKEVSVADAFCSHNALLCV